MLSAVIKLLGNLMLLLFYVLFRRGEATFCVTVATEVPIVHPTDDT